jgi:hypothetical protein
LGEREVVGDAFGAEIEGQDIVGRHFYSLRGAYAGKAGGFEGLGVYTFSGLGNPRLSLVASQVHSPAGWAVGQEEENGPERLLFIKERERAATLSASFVRRRAQSFAAVSVSGGFVWEKRGLLDDNLQPERVFRLSRESGRLAEGRVTLSFSRARSFAFTLGSQEGISGFLSARVREELSLSDSIRDVVGFDRSFQEVTGRVQFYRGVPGPGFSQHVLGVRASGGSASGPGADAFHFNLGDASGSTRSLAGLGVLGEGPLLFPLRGFPRGVRSGRYAWSVSAEYRFPLALVNRGLALFPLHIDRLGGAVFLDAGNAWGPDLGAQGVQNSRRGSLSSVGAELLVAGLPFWTRSLLLRGGVALPLTEEAGFDRGVSTYLRIGLSF